MRQEPLPAIAAVISYIDAINRGDVDRLGALMAEDHHLDVFDEPPLRDRAANIDAWRGYASAYPAYVIHPHRISERDGEVAVLGHTTGSHLGLADHDEMRLRLIWIARRQTRQLVTRRGHARTSRAPRAPRLRLASARAVTGIQPPSRPQQCKRTGIPMARGFGAHVLVLGHPAGVNVGGAQVMVVTFGSCWSRRRRP